jgi:glycosyltransferase involved in cell wall biosynthesis
MRIVYVSYQHPAITAGGVQQLAYELFEASERQGHLAYLIAAPEEHHRAAYGKTNTPIVPVASAERQCLYFPQGYDDLNLSNRDKRSIRFFRELIKRLRPDIVHFHHLQRIGVESIRAARLAAPNAILSFTFHDMASICMADGAMLKQPSRVLCEAASPHACGECFPNLQPEFVAARATRLKAALGDCDLFVFPSEFIAYRYVDWGLAADKCVVVPNGQKNLTAGRDEGMNREHSPHVNRFGFFGEVTDDSGLDLVFEALIILARENRMPPDGIVIEINVENRDNASPAYREKIGLQLEQLRNVPKSSIEIRDNGSCERHQLAERMASIDWVLVPSTGWEVFGVAVSEAWMFGRPVIAAAIGALEERVIAGVNGYLCSPRDARALSELLASLAGNPAKWTAANAGIEPPMTDDEMLEGYVTIWQELRETGRAPLRHAATAPPPPQDNVREEAWDYPAPSRANVLRQHKSVRRLPNAASAKIVEELYTELQPAPGGDAPQRGIARLPIDR